MLLSILLYCFVIAIVIIIADIAVFTPIIIIASIYILSIFCSFVYLTYHLTRRGHHLAKPRPS